MSIAPAAIAAKAAPATSDSLAEIRQRITRREYASAESMARRRLAAGRFGADSLRVANLLDALVRSLRGQGPPRHEEAKLEAERVVTLRERIQGPQHLDLAGSLRNLAAILEDAEDYDAARPLFERVLAIRERALGPNHAEVADALSELAILHAQMGDYPGARPLFERALAIREKALGPDDPRVASSLDNVASVLRLLGEGEKAKPLYERALAIREKALGPDDPDVASTLNNLSNVMIDIGDYVQAKALNERALAIREKALGPDDPDVAESLSSLAIALSALGDYAGAIACSKRSNAIREKALGPDDPSLAEGLDNLANDYQKLEDFASAKPLIERGLAIREKALGPDHPDVAYSLSNLAILLLNTGDAKKAIPIAERALAIRVKALGPEQPDVATTLTILGDAHRVGGDLAGAISPYERSLAIREKVLGPDHPDVASSLDGIACVKLASGDTRGALAAAFRAERIGREHLHLTMRTLPERQAIEYASVRPSGLDVALAAAGAGSVPDSTRRVLDVVVRSRALVLDEMGMRHDALGASGEIGARAQAYTAAQQQLADAIVRGPTDMSPERFRAFTDSLRRVSEDAESRLAASSTRFERDRARREVGLTEVAAALGPDDALVSYVKFPRFQPNGLGPPDSAGHHPTTYEYAAFIVHGGSKSPDVVALGHAEEVDHLVARWRFHASRAPVLPAGESECRAAGAALRARIWDPVIAHATRARRVFVVPDGALHLVSFAALPVGDRKYMVETGPTIHYLSAERDLVPSRTDSRVGHGLLAMGGPDFDADPSTVRPDGDAVAAVGGAGIPTETTYRGAHSSCGWFHDMRFSPLPDAKGEVEDVASSWSNGPVEVTLRTGEAATETSFKSSAPGCRVIHVATHGFFVEDRCSTTDRSARADSVSTAAPESPMRMSGLAFAGANHRDAVPAGRDDGILTAEEIAALDLSGVEWAVLSACDTGVGEITASEGVLGLRRAFEVAGARTLIMSLWSVDDASTRAWMRALYHARFRKNVSTPDALRQASLSIIAERRSKKTSTHPFYWAAFVAAGDSR